MAQYIYGKNTVCERIKKGATIEKIYVFEKLGDNKIHHLIEKSKLPFEMVDRKFLDKITNNANHQGLVAIISSYDYFTVEEIINEPCKSNFHLLVMLDGLEDPHNLGAVLRTCDAVGVDGVIIPKHNSVSLTPTVAKVSTGAIEHVKVARVTNLTSTLKDLKKHGFWVVGAEAENSIDYRSVDYNVPIVLVIGGEGKGISRLVKEQCDFRIKIPMIGHVNSLNASVATSVILYQIFTHRNPIK
jgi:23S rRNA (guanosine2251-2'-O)-methyltransferase